MSGRKKFTVGENEIQDRREREELKIGWGGKEKMKYILHTWLANNNKKIRNIPNIF